MLKEFLQWRTASCIAVSVPASTVVLPRYDSQLENASLCLEDDPIDSMQLASELNLERLVFLIDTNPLTFRQKGSRKGKYFPRNLLEDPAETPKRGKFRLVLVENSLFDEPELEEAGRLCSGPQSGEELEDIGRLGAAQS